MSAAPPASDAAVPPAYILDDQVGFVLRQVQQRHTVIFASAFGEDMTPLQWAALSRLAEVGECSQNQLGRLIATDVATIKGVVERLAKRGLIEPRPDPSDRRRVILRLSDRGLNTYRTNTARALTVSYDTLGPLGPAERVIFMTLLNRLR